MPEVMMALPEDSPLMAAWRRYQDSDRYANSMDWAGRDPAKHMEGAMWSAYENGWKDALASLSTLSELAIPPGMKPGKTDKEELVRVLMALSRQVNEESVEADRQAPYTVNVENCKAGMKRLREMCTSGQSLGKLGRTTFAEVAEIINRPCTLLVSGAVLNRMLPTEWVADLYDPVSEYRHMQRGWWGTMFGMRVFSDFYLHTRDRFLKNGEIYAVATSDHSVQFGSLDDLLTYEDIDEVAMGVVDLSGDSLERS